MSDIGVNEARPRRASLTRRGLTIAATRLVKWAALFAIAPLMMQACSSASPITEAANPGRYSLHATAAGGSVAWARSHKAVMQSASDFCQQRGQMLSVVSESSKGVRPLEEHETELTFECHSRF
ncbi:conserved hypothetical protein [Paraburkholderia piptadeniae]|uniref:Lipoprotein n=1 Tax=Paraburkholderia piptadeniae TaxID=1701573 RepID=A0A1N7SH36_9BURK|nr:conserved hypothetical protein [Paraburkholderia piptadeniae]